MADPTANRTNVVAVRLDADELARWKDAAAADGRVQLGQWVRETIEAGIDRREPTATRSSKVIGGLRMQNHALAAIARELERILQAGAVSDDALERIEATIYEAKQIRPDV